MESTLLSLLRVPRPGEAVADWHINPVIDVFAYGFSWLLILVPLALAGETHPTDYLALWAAGITVSFLHRHFTMPYVYLDGAVFQTHKTRFTLLPAVAFCGFVASVMLQKAKVPAHFVSTFDVAAVAAAVVVVVAIWWRDRQGVVFSNRMIAAASLPFFVAIALGATGLWQSEHVVSVAVVAALAVVAAVVCAPATGAAVVVVVVAVVAVGVVGHAAVGAVHDDKFKGSLLVGPVAMVAALWNIWHTPAQKVGILRVYNAKSRAAVDDKVPLWVDRLLVLGWFPLLAALLPLKERDTILKQGAVVKVYLEPLVNGLVAVAPVLIPIGVVVVVVSIVTFLRYEWRSTRLTNKPRLMMALGMTLLSASFLFVSPLKVYVAYGFSHAIEYVVFVWAYQRKRYSVPHQPQPILQKLLRHTSLFYGLFTLVIAGTYFHVEFGNEYGFFDGKVRLLGYTAGTWLYCWAIWHSLTHFYFDGFLWKMRAPTVRAHL
jgi:hypothetical protein